MKKDKRKILKNTLFILVLVLVAGFGVNWYLTYRLQSYLRQRLSDQIAQASNGFYHFSFDHLEVGLFDGELSLQGVTFEPDSVTFERWKLADSLPQIYFKVDVESISLKGINLTWRKDYSKLHFKLFEVVSPNVEMVQLVDRQEKVKKNKSEKTLYEITSSFFDEISVEEMNLVHADISLKVEDSISTSRYGLNDIHFHAYDFLLDKKATQNHKLLYCQNFEFEALSPQTLLKNDVLSLTTQSVRLSTIDSLIQVAGIELTPLMTDGSLSNYLDANLEKLDIKGIYFERLNSQNYLKADSFNINSSQIEYFEKKTKSSHTDDLKKKQKIDTLVESWSLYTLVSPVLQSVIINHLSTKNGSVKYTRSDGLANDVYTLGRVDVQATGFKLDSLSDLTNRYWHFDEFSFDAYNISGSIANNNNLTVNRIVFNDSEKYLHIHDVVLSPIDKNVRPYHVSIKTDLIAFEGIDISQGIDVAQVNIHRPIVEYTKVKSVDKQRAKEEKFSSRLNIPLIAYINIHKINVEDASLTYNDKSSNESYVLKNLNAYGNDLSVKKNTQFSHKDFGFEFNNFDNYVMNGNYRARIAKGSFASADGHLVLNDVSFLPQGESKESQISIESHRIEAKGLEYLTNVQKIIAKSLNIESPEIRIVKGNPAEKSKTDDAKHFPSIEVGSVAMNKAKLFLQSTQGQDDINLTLDKLQMKDVIWGDSPGLGLLDVDNINLAVDNADLKLKLHTEKLKLDNAHYSSQSLALNSFYVKQPTVEIVQKGKSKQQKTESNKDVFDMLKPYASSLSINHFNVDDADMDYTLLDGNRISMKQNLNNVNLNFEGLAINTTARKIDLANLGFSLSDFRLPVMDSFYTVEVGKVDLNKKDNRLVLSNLRLIPKYPKLEFAYRHPKHKDWFNASIDNITLSGIDIPASFNRKMIKATDLQVQNVVLENFKNQQIEIQHNIMPMIYEGLQKLPIKIDIDNADVRNINIMYEELARNSTNPAKIFFTDLNGKLKGLTNVATTADQFIELQADGLFMGTGSFTATWMIPVDTTYDRFLLSAHVKDFDLKELNQIISPMAPVEVKDGFLNDLIFEADASSKGATIRMSFLYNDLRVDVYRKVDGESHHKLFSKLANAVLKTNNPDKIGKSPRESFVTIERDPYHSTFNYFWQILQPPLVESVGVGKGRQDAAKRASGFFNKIKKVFKSEKKKEE